MLSGKEIHAERAPKRNFLCDGFLVIEDVITDEACDGLVTRTAKLVDEFNPARHCSIFSTTDQEQTIDEHILGSSDKIRLSLRTRSIQHGRQISRRTGAPARTALIFGKWKPLPTLLACFLLAFAQALEARLHRNIPGVGIVSVQAIQTLPYVLTILLLAGFVGKAISPKANGLPYVKEK